MCIGDHRKEDSRRLVDIVYIDKVKIFSPLLYDLTACHVSHSYFMYTFYLTREHDIAFICRFHI